MNSTNANKVSNKPFTNKGKHIIIVKPYINLRDNYLKLTFHLLTVDLKLGAQNLINKGVNLITINSQGWNLNFSIETILIL